ncbi:M1 family metallopeptidase [Polaribacter glomeratus]|uniref:Aminopeptidase n=1 Tax=Polaribacter glomeratus TaxID=102 RepID=A0A2S7WX82_9FLAO|nr:M1 family metallopeptidase [Polaribacter glomeratus]PQJ82157.1 aminopeptidase [Polaribacter glomeratus]TXD66752.1 M1 family metallopeptidase [Polaribacter glomeratus]
MKKLGILLLSLFFIANTFAQKKEVQQGHTNQNKFKQLKDEFATPNDQRTASGAPGKNYTQQKVDYVMDIVLDDEKQKITGAETITYHNNSRDELTYLWLQLDQNMRAADSKSPDIETAAIPEKLSQAKFNQSYPDVVFDGGFKIMSVTNIDGSSLSYTINQTMMRINLPKPLASGATFKFNVKWWYYINNHITQGGRSGFEHFEDGNNNYVIAQFYPRLCVYDNVEGWQNDQFWGRSEFALEFGDFTVNITVPEDHMLGATGVLKNETIVLSKKEQERLAIAKKTFDKPVLIRSQEEAEQIEKGNSKKTKTWKFFAENVRDYAFATSRKFIWDAMAVDINGKTVMAYSLYSKEANPLYGDHSTRAVAQTLKTYSKFTFEYPYHKAISVDGQMGMEYPQICFNPGRPDLADGGYSDKVKYRMIKVTIHEVGHNFFPMIVNSDERQWTWMDEGLNSYMEMQAELDYDKDFPITRGYPKNIVGYMNGDQSLIAPIMTKGDNVYEFGNNAYGKPATALWILRETIMGKELFDHAFKTYSQRWMFKHPSPEDFFRTMEDASGVDLDWFWRGWFYTTDVTDIGVKGVKKFYTTQGDDEVVFTEDASEGLGFSKKHKKYHYEITYNKPGGLVMPIIVEFTYKDGTKERKTYPAQIWRLNDKEVTKVFSSSKEIENITIDPDLETADVDTTNNNWPQDKTDKFDQFKNKIKG